MTPEDVLAKHCDCPMEHIERNIIMEGYRNLIINAMKEYGDQRATEMRDKTLDLLSKHILDGGALGGYWKELFETKVMSFNVHPSLQP